MKTLSSNIGKVKFVFVVLLATACIILSFGIVRTTTKKSSAIPKAQKAGGEIRIKDLKRPPEGVKDMDLSDKVQSIREELRMPDTEPEPSDDESGSTIRVIGYREVDRADLVYAGSHFFNVDDINSGHYLLTPAPSGLPFPGETKDATRNYVKDDWYDRLSQQFRHEPDVGFYIASILSDEYDYEAYDGSGYKINGELYGDEIDIQDQSFYATCYYSDWVENYVLMLFPTQEDYDWAVEHDEYITVGIEERPNIAAKFLTYLDNNGKKIDWTGPATGYELFYKVGGGFNFHEYWNFHDYNREIKTIRMGWIDIEATMIIHEWNTISPRNNQNFGRASYTQRRDNDIRFGISSFSPWKICYTAVIYIREEER